MKKRSLYYCLVSAGILLTVLGVFIIKLSAGENALPYVCIGVGCGLFGHGAGEIISQRALKNHPDIRRNIEIEKNDERNIAIAEKAKSRAFDMMTFVFGALMLSFAIMGIDMTAVLLLVGAYLLVEIYAVYCRCRYEKEM